MQGTLKKKKHAGLLLEEVKVFPETKLARNIWLLFVPLVSQIGVKNILRPVIVIST